MRQINWATVLAKHSKWWTRKYRRSYKWKRKRRGWRRSEGNVLFRSLVALSANFWALRARGIDSRREEAEFRNQIFLPEKMDNNEAQGAGRLTMQGGPVSGLLLEIPEVCGVLF